MRKWACRAAPPPAWRSPPNRGQRRPPTPQGLTADWRIAPAGCEMRTGRAAHHPKLGMRSSPVTPRTVSRGADVGRRLRKRGGGAPRSPRGVGVGGAGGRAWRIKPCTLPATGRGMSSALTKFSNAAQRFPNGRPVGPNFQLHAEPLGSVRAQWGPTETQQSPFPLGFSSPFAGDGHISNTIESRQGHL